MVDQHYDNRMHKIRNIYTQMLRRWHNSIYLTNEDLFWSLTRCLHNFCETRKPSLLVFNLEVLSELPDLKLSGIEVRELGPTYKWQQYSALDCKL